MPSVTPTEIVLPKYVTMRKVTGRGGVDRYEFRFEVPKRLRPEGFLPCHRLPLDTKLRTGDCSWEEVRAVEADGKTLFAQLTHARQGRKDPLDLAALTAEQQRGTVLWLIMKFKETDRWNGYEESSQRNYKYGFREIVSWSATRKPKPHPPLAMVTVPELALFIGRFKSMPYKQRAVAVALHALFDIARLEGLIKEDPSRRLPMAERPGTNPIEWTADVVDEACRRASEKGLNSVALFLRIKWWNGWRSTEILRLREPTDYKDGHFGYRTGKKSRWVGAEATPDVVELISKTRPAIVQVPFRYMIVNENTGNRFNERTLLKHITWILEDMGRTDLKPGWLRHTVMTTLDELDVHDGASAALVGHSPSSHARMKDQHYRIRSPKLAKIATDKLVEHRKKK